MKKIACAVLFVSLVASANLKAEDSETSRWNKYGKTATIATASTVGLAGLGYLAYKDYKNDQKAKQVLNATLKLIKENPKAAAGILTAIVGTTGLTLEFNRGQDENGVEKSVIKKSAKYVADKSVAGKDTVKGWFKIQDKETTTTGIQN